MAFQTSVERNGHIFERKQSGNLGPCSYEPKPSFVQDKTPQRRLKGKSVGFGSSMDKDLNTYEGPLYSPGPGFYSNKYTAAFSEEIMRADKDQESYFVIQNGTLLRKAQIMAANKNISRQPEHDAILKKKDWPGPGTYSPHAKIKSPNSQFKNAAMALMALGLDNMDTMRTSFDNQGTLQSFRRDGSGVEI